MIAVQDPPQNLWYCLSLSDLLNQCAWDGQTPHQFTEVNRESALSAATLSHFEALEDASKPLECWSVKAFFSQINWHNRRRLRQSASGSETIDLDLQDFTAPLANPLTVSVDEFLHHIAWEGQPVIAALPKTQPLTAHPPADDLEMTLNNLSTLF